MKLIFLVLVFDIISIVSLCQNTSINPPGTIQVRENLFFDITELRNLDYLEFVAWTKRIFGENSIEYKELIIDSLVLSYDDLNNPIYNYYPLVGITHEQAVNYCEWRSDRVYELRLIQEKVIKYNQNQNRDYYFSIKNVLNGNYKIASLFKLDKIQIPKYRLPTIEEWEYAASGGLDLNQYPFGIDSFSFSKNQIFSKDSFALSYKDINKLYQANGFGLYNMIGNVAEMVDEKGIAKGCTSANLIKDCEIANYGTYSKPENWLGFRCVCEYKKCE